MADSDLRFEVRVEAWPDPFDVALLEGRVRGETIRDTGWNDEQELGVFARDAAQQVCAGAYGWTWGECAELLHLWVDRSMRRTGVAGRLLDHFEGEAQRRGCGQVVVTTHSEVLARIYGQRNYVERGRVDHYPAGQTAIWFCKDLHHPRT